MGVRLVATSTGALTTAGTSLSFSHDGGSTANRLLLVAVATRLTTATVSSLTYNGIALASLTSLNNSTNVRLEVWYLVAPASGSNTVAITVAGSTALAAWARTFEDAHQTTPFGTAATDVSLLDPASATPTSGAYDITIDAIAYGTSNQSAIAGAEQADALLVKSILGGATSSDVSLGGSTQPGNAASDAMSWDFTSGTQHVLIAVPLLSTGTLSLARVTQATAEALVQPTTQRARVTQLVTEALTQPANTQRARLSQLVVEALYASDLPPAPTGAAVKRWDGSAWQTAAVKRWDGAAWVTATVKRWNGSAWV